LTLLFLCVLQAPIDVAVNITASPDSALVGSTIGYTINM
jgi:hypothetical protein